MGLESRLKKKLVLYEGKIPHMYLDSVGKVTVGVGHMLPNLAAAQKLSFVNAKNAAASAADIKTDWDAVVAKGKGFKASAYKHDKSLTLPSSKIEAQMSAHIKSFRTELKKIFPDFASYSEDVRLALFDMIFNLGMTNLRKKFPTFVKAVKDKDWTKAASECKRKGISGTRNAFVKGLFEGEAKKSADDTGDEK
ncbi:hypothetical protein [uncultured Tateyamaria sp.]|uniref:glycoside hydrolase family protein n=1 Tax=uncultured Tateyamaria sp. TaxID=455651 RepID=UPI00262C0CDA|nr:hypothetical protein [uncultured Tateyamaria sp.]